MTSGLTTREVSQRLKEAGFSANTIHNWVLVKDVNGVEDYELKEWYNSDSCPAYSASTLFEWLRAKYHSDPNLALDIQATEITIWLNIGHNPDEEEKEFEYKTSLADMLGESIIWILTQEKENK